MIASRVITVAFASAILALPKIVIGQVPEGYTLATTIAALPDSLVEVREGGRFRVTVARVARDSFETTLIHTAERLTPHRDTIARAASTVRGGDDSQALTEASRLSGARWWWREADGVLLPFALTGAAVEYYISRVRDLSSQPNPFARYRPGVLHTAAVEYTARVVRSDVETTPIRVELKLRFQFYCGSTCALWFTHSRTVEFDVSGRAIRVIGDRPPLYGIS
jgi:hypothetical protein